MKTIVRMLHEAAERFPARAYTTKKTDAGWQPYTYRDVDNASDQVAAYLIAQGITANLLWNSAEGRPEWGWRKGIIKARCISDHFYKHPAKSYLPPYPYEAKVHCQSKPWTMCASTDPMEVTHAPVFGHEMSG